MPKPYLRLDYICKDAFIYTNFLSTHFFYKLKYIILYQRVAGNPNSILCFHMYAFDVGVNTVD